MSSTEVEERATLPDAPLSTAELRLADNIDDIFELKRWMGQRRPTPLGVDTETTGFNPHKGNMRLCQFGDPMTGWAVPWEGWNGACMELLNAYDGEIVMHNMPFDARWLAVHGRWDVPWSRLHDTMAMAHLDNTSRPRGLKSLADRLVDPHASAGEKILQDGMRQQGWTWETVPYDWAPYWVYAAADPVLTTRIFQKLAPEVLENFAQPYDIELAASRFCANMMMHGLLVDVPYVTENIRKLTEYAEAGRQWLASEWGITSPMSGQQISKAWERCGVPILFHTTGGGPSFDKHALEFYVGNFPQLGALGSTLRNVRRAEKIVGTYLSNFLEMRDSADMLHYSLWVTGARTSRMSSSDPNMQNLTRDDKVVRGSFIPHPGMALLSIDADQIEARLAAHFSADPGLIAAFDQADRDGTDFFSIVASEIFRTEIAKSDPRRQRTKNTIYGKIYGAGLDKMALTAGVPVDQMRPVFEGLRARYPGLDRMMGLVTAYGRTHLRHGMPSVVTPTGRTLTCTPGKEYVLTNYLIQGHAGEVLKLGAARLEAAGFGPYMALPVHDEIIFEVPEDQADDLLHQAEEILCDRESYRVPITWSGKVMKERWVKE